MIIGYYYDIYLCLTAKDENGITVSVQWKINNVQLCGKNTPYYAYGSTLKCNIIYNYLYKGLYIG